MSNFCAVLFPSFRKAFRVRFVASKEREREREREFERQQREKGEKKAAKREERADCSLWGKKREKKHENVM